MILAWVNDIYDGINAFVIGMRTTATFFVENVRNSGGATAVTQQYPQEPAVVVGDRVRGHLFNKADICIVCHACDKACPVDCFVMDGERDANNKMRASRFDIDLSKCIYCGLCVRACPTDSLSMTTGFEVDPHNEAARFLFRRNSSQLDKHLDAPDVVRMAGLVSQPRETLSQADRDWLDSVIDPRGEHLIGMYGMGYFTPEEKAKADAERERKKQEKAAAAAAAKAAKAAIERAAAEKELVAKEAAQPHAPTPQPPAGGDAS
jgi:NADH-quinone oxidoreductase subunit I